MWVAIRESRLLLMLLLFADLIHSALCSRRRKLILLLIDGFANWFMDPEKCKRKPLAGFDLIAQAGTRARYLLPEFPTQTLPNQHSLVTGRYPANHGIIGNVMFDQENGRLFNFLKQSSDVDKSWWNGSEPLWITAQKSNISTSVYWWRGCEVDYGKEWNLSVECIPFESPETSVELLSLIPDILHNLDTDQRQLVFISYGMVAETARRYGPFSGRTNNKIEQISNILFQLQQAMEAFELQEKVNLVVASTHGMSSVPINNLYFLDDFLDMDSLLHRVVDDGPWMLLYPKPGMDFQVFQALDGVIPYTTLYWGHQLLERWKLRDGRHLPPLLLVCDAGYGIYCRNQDKQLPRTPDILTADHFPRGLSGYDNSEEEMRAVFLARGPDFKQNYEHGWLRMVDIYQILCHVLQIDCHPHDGSWERVEQMLNRAPSPLQNILLIIVFIVIILVK